MKNKKYYLWVWADMLADYTEGIAFAFARTESEAWEKIKESDPTAWWAIRGRPKDQNDIRQPAELSKSCRPRKVVKSEAFTCWGGG